jgi:hypothetical protein
LAAVSAVLQLSPTSVRHGVPSQVLNKRRSGRLARNYRTRRSQRVAAECLLSEERQPDGALNIQLRRKNWCDETNRIVDVTIEAIASVISVGVIVGGFIRVGLQYRR